jgi:hypothetical protein
MAAETELVPYRDEVVDQDRKLSSVWSSFYRTIQNLVLYIKRETSFPLVNNQVAAANIEGLSFDKRYYSQAIVEYLIQRVTSGSGLIESGRVVAVYSPFSDAWTVAKVADVSVGVIGVTFSITAAGQIQYTTTNQAGTASISRIVYRLRQIEAKSSLYSQVG